MKDDLKFFGREKLIGEVSDIAKKVEECGELLGRKIDSTKDELAYIGSNLEELWRIKCEIKGIRAYSYSHNTFAPIVDSFVLIYFRTISKKN